MISIYNDGKCSLCQGNYWKQTGKIDADGALICGFCWYEEACPRCFKCKTINYSVPQDGIITCFDCKLSICNNCGGPFHQATGHMLKDGNIWIRSCGVCAGKFFAWKLSKEGWKPKHEYGETRYSRRMDRLNKNLRAQTGSIGNLP